MKKIWQYLDKIIKSNTNESSKRFIAVVSLFFLIVQSFVFTTQHNWTTTLGMWLSFILTLLGFAVYEKLKSK